MSDGHKHHHGINAKDLALKAQKKILSKMSTRKVAKVFIDDAGGRVLDNIYGICKEYANKKEAEKVVKNTIKLVVKIGILYRNEKFSEAELRIAAEFRQKFHTIVMTVMSFYDLDFSLDTNFLIKHLKDCRRMLHQMIEQHLTEKTQHRVDHVFDFFMNPAMLTVVFDRGGPYRHYLDNIVEDLNKMVDDNAV
ncbi:tumor necrosis factor alpha-induced protein 8-like protein 1 [Tubulanus polymorphus]|uniref:tumor necrosis factor alpha-induced protein 8-like protein 1 n=1 Tax=Tubulanus polymorphus TaxID=672921 RepID=UPI003DA515C3